MATDHPFDINPLLLTDFYKVGHPFQYPPGTRFVFSNLTPRKSRHQNIQEMVVFGPQYLCQHYLIDYFNRNFFRRPRGEVVAEYKRRIRTSIGDLPSYDHIEALHELGYLPVRIKALPEGSRVPMRVPCLTVVNTLPEFYWVTNFLETLLSATLWQPCTSATLAYEFRKSMNKHAEMTGLPPEFVQWQGHDFSFRGMSSLESAILSGMAHLLSFTGTDTIPAIDALERYYGADAEAELVGGSVPATEHSVMCSGQKDCELKTIRRLITEIYPKGIVSIVSDTWDLWKVLTEYLPQLADIIMARDGKVVVRPDSGDPVDIICGDSAAQHRAAQAGVVELLAETFGAPTNTKGFRVLDPHVGAIYGDSINLERERAMAERLMAKGFATQVVLGIGSYTYQYNTRDTFGTAMKATHVVIGEDRMDIFKTPITDDGTKNSATGLLRVDREGGRFVLRERVTPAEEAGGELRTIFQDGEIVNWTTLEEIRRRLWEPVPHAPVDDWPSKNGQLDEMP